MKVWVIGGQVVTPPIKWEDLNDGDVALTTTGEYFLKTDEGVVCLTNAIYWERGTSSDRIIARILPKGTELRLVID